MNPTISQLAKSYAFFDESDRDKHLMVPLFNVWPCEICATELTSPNGVRVLLARRVLEAHGVKNRARPVDEGGWSELHGMATCSSCHDDPTALARHGVVITQAKGLR